jgi:tRNA pseudouridine38-40 synthase
MTLAYDGAQFLGFQRQANTKLADRRTVQGVIETALRQLGWNGRSILLAGRTDTGVHASGQVVAFDLEWAHNPEALQAALNACLPQDVVVNTVHIVRQDFHPRFDAVARRYQYRIYCKPIRDPLRDRYAWRVWPPAAVENLQAAADALVGTHDFAAFGASPRPEGSTIRTVFSASWYSQGEDQIFEIMANAFLYRMVRRLVYVQVAIAQNKLEPGIVQEKLASGSRRMLQGLAPPQGLVLVEVIYE